MFVFLSCPFLSTLSAADFSFFFFLFTDIYPFQFLFDRFWAQLTTGCGGDCNYTFCASNRAQQEAINALSQPERAAITLKLSLEAQKAIFSQVASPVSELQQEEPYLDLEKLKRVVKECREANTNVALVRLLGAAFRSSNALSMSFLKHPLRASPIGEDFGINVEHIREAYKLIQTMPENVSNSLHSAIETMASQLAHTANSIFHPHQLRQFIILLEYPLLFDPTSHRRLLGPLLMAIQKLPDSSVAFLDRYLQTWSDDRWREWNSTLQNMIALSALEADGEEMEWDPHADELVIAAAQGIGMASKHNEKRHFLGFQDFYSQFVNEKLDVTEDFLRDYLPDAHPGFSYIRSSSYLLNPETKSTLLQLESRVTQQLTVRDQLWQNLLMRGEYMPYLVLRINRERLIPTSLDALRVPSEDLKKQLKVKFVGEEGIDEGGVKKEWFQLVVKELFDAKYGMFTTDKANRLQWFNPASEDFGEFELLGKLLGLAVYNGVILDLHFPSLVYKKLIGKDGNFDDLEQINPDLHKGLKQLLAYQEPPPKPTENQANHHQNASSSPNQQLLTSKSPSGSSNSEISMKEDSSGTSTPTTATTSAPNDLVESNSAREDSVEELFSLNFSVSYEVYGHVQIHELVHDGANIPVTADNRQLYVDLYTDFLLNSSIERQFSRFKQGFANVCDSKIFHLFRYEELELLICGSPVLDFDELEANTSYEGFEKDEITIKNFWTVLHELSLEEKKRFLFFATGTDRAPIGGLARIGLTISKHGEENRLPAAHTCFAVVLLAPTPDLEKMRKSIHVVLENAEGFGMI